MMTKSLVFVPLYATIIICKHHCMLRTLTNLQSQFPWPFSTASPFYCVFVCILVCVLQFHPSVATGMNYGAREVPLMINSRTKLCSWCAHTQTQTTHTTRALHAYKCINLYVFVILPDQGTAFTYVTALIACFVPIYCVYLKLTMCRWRCIKKKKWMWRNVGHENIRLISHLNVCW